jgi:hypothetical protein
MFEYKVVLGVLAILFGFTGYAIYLNGVFRGNIKPHAFSWLVWAFLAGIAFFGQNFDAGGAGTWVTGFTALVCMFVFFLALKKGEKNITFSDKLSLFGAVVALLLWFLTNNPLASIILITLIDVTGGYYPTVRKSYHKPHEETISLYFLSGLKWVVAIAALENYSLITWLYPVSLIITNFLFVGMLIVRRKA